MSLFCSFIASTTYILQLRREYDLYLCSCFFASTTFIASTICILQLLREYEPYSQLHREFPLGLSPADGFHRTARRVFARRYLQLTGRCGLRAHAPGPRLRILDEC